MNIQTFHRAGFAVADKGIPPVNADNFSRAAVHAMLANVYRYHFNQSSEDVCLQFFSGLFCLEVKSDETDLSVNKNFCFLHQSNI